MARKTGLSHFCKAVVAADAMADCSTEYRSGRAALASYDLPSFAVYHFNGFGTC